MAREKIPYSAWLIQQSAAAIATLADGIDTALAMEHESSALCVLEAKISTARELLTGEPNLERVEGRPDDDD